VLDSAWIWLAFLTVLFLWNKLESVAHLVIDWSVIELFFFPDTKSIRSSLLVRRPSVRVWRNHRLAICIIVPFLVSFSSMNMSIPIVFIRYLSMSRLFTLKYEQWLLWVHLLTCANDDCLSYPRAWSMRWKASNCHSLDIVWDSDDTVNVSKSEGHRRLLIDYTIWSMKIDEVTFSFTYFLLVCLLVFFWWYDSILIFLSYHLLRADKRNNHPLTYGNNQASTPYNCFTFTYATNWHLLWTSLIDMKILWIDTLVSVHTYGCSILSVHVTCLYISDAKTSRHYSQFSSLFICLINYIKSFSCFWTVCVWVRVCVCVCS
jgi:hypothetical protein